MRTEVFSFQYAKNNSYTETFIIKLLYFINCSPVKSLDSSLRSEWQYFVLNLVRRGIGWQLRRQPIPLLKYNQLIVISNGVRDLILVVLKIFAEQHKSKIRPSESIQDENKVKCMYFQWYVLFSMEQPDIFSELCEWNKTYIICTISNWVYISLNNMKELFLTFYNVAPTELFCTKD